MFYDVNTSRLAGFTLTVYDKQGGSVDLSGLLRNLSWGGSLQGAAMKMEADLAPYPGLGSMVNLGDQFILLGPDIETGKAVELMRGYIWDKGRNAGYTGGMNLVGYDLLIYLLNNSDDFVFRGVKASFIIQSVCNSFGIPVGTIEDTGHVLDKLIARNTSLYDLFVKALVLTRDATGRKFFIRARGGKLEVREKAKAGDLWVLRSGSNVREASYTETLQGLKTKVAVRSHASDDERSDILSIAENKDLQKSYGLLQEVVTADENGTDKSSSKQIAENTLKKDGKIGRSARVTAIGIPTVMPGDPVFVEEESTGLSGVYYLQDVTFRASGGDLSMDATLAWDDSYQAS